MLVILAGQKVYGGRSRAPEGYAVAAVCSCRRVE